MSEKGCKQTVWRTVRNDSTQALSGLQNITIACYYTCNPMRWHCSYPSTLGYMAAVQCRAVQCSAVQWRLGMGGQRLPPACTFQVEPDIYKVHTTLISSTRVVASSGYKMYYYDRLLHRYGTLWFPPHLLLTSSLSVVPR